MDTFDAKGREDVVCGTLFGHLFEHYFFKELAKGGSFKMKELPSGDGRPNFTAVPRERNDFGTMSEIRRDSATRCFFNVPKASQFAAVDCLTLSDSDALTVFNATSNSVKGKLVMDTVSGGQGLFRVAKAVLKPESTDPIDFVFAVPPRTYETFKVPTKFAWNDCTKSPDKISRPKLGEKDAFVRRIRFYALCVPLSRSLHTAAKKLIPRRIFL